MKNLKLMIITLSIIVVGYLIGVLGSKSEKPNIQMSEWNVNYIVKTSCITFDKSAEIERAIREATKGLNIDIEIEKYNPENLTLYNNIVYGRTEIPYYTGNIGDSEDTGKTIRIDDKYKIG